MWVGSRVTRDVTTNDKDCFGGALWPVYVGDYSVYLAEYHTVSEDARGELIDVSPQPDIYANGTILFMADSRVGFEYNARPRWSPATLAFQHAEPGTGNDTFP